jgi:hypothetical protein
MQSVDLHEHSRGGAEAQYCIDSYRAWIKAHMWATCRYLIRIAPAALGRN